jgi:hypothetical protein
MGRHRLWEAMTEHFFEWPILNSPYSCPVLDWKTLSFIFVQEPGGRLAISKS